MTGHIYGLHYISAGQDHSGSWLPSRGSEIHTHVSFSDDMPFPLLPSLPCVAFFGLLSPFQSDRSSHPGLWGPNSFLFTTALIRPLGYCYCWPLLLPLFFLCLSGLSSQLLWWLLFSLRLINVTIAALSSAMFIVFVLMSPRGYIQFRTPELQTHICQGLLDTPVEMLVTSDSTCLSAVTLVNDVTIYLPNHPTLETGAHSGCPLPSPHLSALSSSDLPESTVVHPYPPFLHLCCLSSVLILSIFCL